MHHDGRVLASPRWLAVVATLALMTACSSGDGFVGGEVPSAGEVPAAGLDRALIEAATAGDTSRVRNLLSDGASVAAVDGTGRTALVAASYGAHLATAAVLIDAGADVNHQDSTRQSAYLIATSEIGPAAGLDLLRLTLANGADVASLDSYRGTGLIRAAHRGYGAIVRELLTAGIAADHVNNLGWTALLEATILGNGGPEHVEVVAALLEGGADPNLADGQGVRPLAHARARGYDAIVALLVARQAR